MPRGLSSYCTPASCDVSAGCVGQPDVQLCNDANTCTKDACGSTGCTHLAQSGPCNDGNPCTPSDACSGGKCLGTGVLSCNDNNVCTLDSCKAGVGCQNAPVGLGAACSDGDVCNGAEACESGVCKPGNILDCDDKDACTTDSCNKTSGCKHAIAMKPWTFLQNGMDGGAFTAIDADPLDAKVVYAGGKGLFRSADGGASWSALSGLASRRISSVKVDLATPGTLYITGVYPVGYYLPDGSDGFFASTDSGKTWKAKNTGLTGATLNRIVLDPADSASLYLVTDKGLFHSSDTGGSWQIVSGMPTVYVAGLAIDPTGKTLLVLGGKPGSATTADVYRSLNGGATFTALGTLPANLGFPRDIAVGPTGTWFAVCSDGGVLRSSDAGSTWAPSSSGMAKTWYGSPASMQWLAMDPGSGSRLWVGTNAGIHRSSDGGVTWKWVQAGLPDLANQGMVAHSDPTDGLFVLTSGRGVFRSDDLGATWIAKSQGLQGVIVSVVAVVPGSTSQLYAMAAFGGQIYRSQDGARPGPTPWER